MDFIYFYIEFNGSYSKCSYVETQFQVTKDHGPDNKGNLRRIVNCLPSFDVK
jgi:hypothetical protein